MLVVTAQKIYMSQNLSFSMFIKMFYLKWRFMDFEISRAKLHDYILALYTAPILWRLHSRSKIYTNLINRDKTNDFNLEDKIVVE